MKKRFFGLFLILALAFVFVGCKDDKDVDGDDYVYDESKTILAEGFTSLANQNANGPIDKDGYYTAGGQKFKTKDVYRTIYQTEPDKSFFNYLTNSWTYNSYHYTNMVDGLVENDKYGNVVGALAKGYKVVDNEDGSQTWTFQLKENVLWVKNADGAEYGEVTAEDFVAGLKYVLQPLNASATVGIVTNLIKGSKEYYNSLADDKVADLSFDTVGVKVVSKYQVSYTLYEKTPYFLTNLTYSPFLPVVQKYLNEKGTSFGKTVNDILVNGAFRIPTHIKFSHMEYVKNQKYYDKEHVYVNKVYRKFLPGTATASTTREWFEAGEIDSFTVNAEDKSGYEKYVTGGENGTGTVKNPVNPLANGILSVGDATYIGYFNFDRDTFEYTDATKDKTEAQKAATAKALKNVDFRKGFLYGLEVIEYLKRYNPADPQEWLMRAYTNRELVSYNGKDYSDYVDDVFNQKQGTTGVSLSGILHGSDPIFNSDKAKQHFQAAKTALLAAGLTEADFPIQIDVIASMNPTNRTYEQAEYGALEAAAKDANGNQIVVINHNIPGSSDQNTKWGSMTQNYDFSLWSGWGPDYADPQTFLHTMIVGGDMVDSLGFGKGTAENKALEQEILGAYTALYEKGAKITDASKLEERYKAFAEAEYALIYEYAIIVPWLTQSGYSPSVARTIPYQAGRASYGLTSDKFKNVVVSSDIMTKELRKAVVDEYENNK